MLDKNKIYKKGQMKITQVKHENKGFTGLFKMYEDGELVSLSKEPIKIEMKAVEQ